jgi:NNP family nitrate/nitrite transporter-like MFS transporter
MGLPSLALWFGGADGWRWAVASTGLIAFAYAAVFYRSVRNTPKGSTYFKPRKSGGLEVTSRRDLVFYIAMNVPMYLALAMLVWKLSPQGVALLDPATCTTIYVGLAALFAIQVRQIFRVNREMLVRPVPKLFRYSFKQIAVLDIAYAVTFGSELAVVSMLPLFFIDTWSGLDPAAAGLFAASFAFTNLVARPGGGWLSDRYGRKRTLSTLIAGLASGYGVMSGISGSWPIAFGVLAMMACSFCVQAGSGAIFAMVPLVKRRLTGQIAGMAGAYGNVGAVAFLTVLSFVDYATFFLAISGSATVALAAVQFLEETSGHTAEILEDGSVELIEAA